MLFTLPSYTMTPHLHTRILYTPPTHTPTTFTLTHIMTYTQMREIMKSPRCAYTDRNALGEIYRQGRDLLSPRPMSDLTSRRFPTTERLRRNSLVPENGNQLQLISSSNNFTFFMKTFSHFSKF